MNEDSVRRADFQVFSALQAESSLISDPMPSPPLLGPLLPEPDILTPFLALFAREPQGGTAPKAPRCGLVTSGGGRRTAWRGHAVRGPLSRAPRPPAVNVDPLAAITRGLPNLRL